MTKILMVCLGNICRSPVAEGILKYKLKDQGLDDVFVDSAGTSGLHAGEAPDKRAVESARRHGVDISSLIARQFTAKDFDEFDYIYVMDKSNYENVLSMARSEGDKKKVKLILNCHEPGCDRPVPDPYWSGEEGFENVFNLLDCAADAIIRELKVKN